MSDVLAEIRAFVEKEFLPEGSDDRLGPEENLLQRGILDSIAVLQVVNFLEQTYDIKIEDPEITLENFQDLASIARLVSRKASAPR